MKMVAELESQVTYNKSFKYPIFLMAEILSHIPKSVPGGLTLPAQNHTWKLPLHRIHVTPSCQDFIPSYLFFKNNLGIILRRISAIMLALYL